MIENENFDGVRVQFGLIQSPEETTIKHSAL